MPVVTIHLNDKEYEAVAKYKHRYRLGWRDILVAFSSIDAPIAAPESVVPVPSRAPSPVMKPIDLGQVDTSRMPFKARLKLQLMKNRIIENNGYDPKYKFDEEALMTGVLKDKEPREEWEHGEQAAK